MALACRQCRTRGSLRACCDKLTCTARSGLTLLGQPLGCTIPLPKTPDFCFVLWLSSCSNIHFIDFQCIGTPRHSDLFGENILGNAATTEFSLISFPFAKWKTESSNDNRNTRRRLDPSSSPADEHARSAVLPRFSCEQYHTGLRGGSTLFGKGPRCVHTINLSEFIVKQVLCRSGLYLNHEPNVKILLSDIKRKDVIDSPFCCTKTNIIVRQSTSIEDREIGKQFAPLWRELADQLKIFFPDGDDEGAFIVPALDVRSQVLSMKYRRNGVGKPVFKPAPFGSGQTFAFVSPELSVPGVLPDVLQTSCDFLFFWFAAHHQACHCGPTEQ